MELERTRLAQDESGQALTEYSLLVGVIASIVISLSVLFRTELGAMLSAIGAHLTDVASRLT
ncbi:MAG: Flp family type IVb pilin [Gemmatimonadota bacterium]